MHADAERRHLIQVGSGAAQRPNIVFVLTDDLSMDLLRYMPAVQALEHRGMTFTNYFVSDSLCCPSRASIFTGNYPHDTDIWTNDPPAGGFALFDQPRRAAAYVQQRPVLATGTGRR